MLYYMVLILFNFVDLDFLSFFDRELVTRSYKQYLSSKIPLHFLYFFFFSQLRSRSANGLILLCFLIKRNMLSQILSFYFLNLNLCFISAHITLNHQREIRYRCKNCPLTFLKKKAFVLHHREKHKESIEPWCPLCFEIFDGLKQREDHSCGKIENTGRITICHKHDPPLEFR